MSNKTKVNVSAYRKRKEAGEKIVMITAYDAPGAAAAFAAGIDMLLVGDSMAMTVLGYRNTLPLSMDEAIFHTQAVRRGAPDAFVIFDMPFMSYQVSMEEALRNAGRAIKEAGADAVKLEGGAELNPLISRLVDAGIPVMAHIGLLPQRIQTSGTYRVTGAPPKPPPSCSTTPGRSKRPELSRWCSNACPPTSAASFPERWPSRPSESVPACSATDRFRC